ncbi:MAG: hypothetical protein JXA92_04335 [candidate division Zixibacteria bacterium]|nr:hypothetical protein [candidate division Zixibacteria bacterium]
MSLSCGGDEKPAPKEIGMDTLTAAEKTADFSLFPAENKVEGSNEFLEKSFLEIPALDFVYTVDYDIDGDVFKLFLTRDYSGVKYINFRAAAGSETELRPYPEEILFDEDYGFMYDHPEYGTVIVGLKNNRLVGIMGFDDDARVSLFADWVATFPKPETPVTESKENK